MPYIKKENRAKIDVVVTQLVDAVESPGEINYAITRFLHSLVAIVRQRNFGYALLNALIGVLECAKLEFYRMVVAPYENKKRMENGPVSDLDAKTLEDVR